jgi:hypothetical protein
MIRAAISTAILAVISPAIGHANGSSLPAMPEWQTDANNCSWHWSQGDRIGLWAETCRFNGATWQVVWDDDLAAFVTKNDEIIMGIAVQAFTLSGGASISTLSETLVEAGSLDVNNACIWQTIALRPAPRAIAFHVLTPKDQAALSPAVSGDIPEPACGPYGASTHGVRYFMTDLRWRDLAIFVEEGQERPMFDPSSITALP